MEKNKKTDVLLNVQNLPFVTLIESKMPNIWYHDDTDVLFRHTSSGFKIIKGSKKVLKGRGVL